MDKFRLTPSHLTAFLQILSRLDPHDYSLNIMYLHYPTGSWKGACISYATKGKARPNGTIGVGSEPYMDVSVLKLFVDSGVSSKKTGISAYDVYSKILSAPEIRVSVSSYVSEYTKQRHFIIDLSYFDYKD